jgi:ABC-type transporter Mla subunit MlaD
MLPTTGSTISQYNQRQLNAALDQANALDREKAKLIENQVKPLVDKMTANGDEIQDLLDRSDNLTFKGPTLKSKIEQSSSFFGCLNCFNWFK